MEDLPQPSWLDLHRFDLVFKMLHLSWKSLPLLTIYVVKNKRKTKGLGQNADGIVLTPLGFASCQA